MQYSTNGVFFPTLSGVELELQQSILGRLSESGKRIVKRDGGLFLAWSDALHIQDVLDDDKRSFREQKGGLSSADLEVLSALFSLHPLPAPTTMKLQLRQNGYPGKHQYKLDARWIREKEGRVRACRPTPKVQEGALFRVEDGFRRMTSTQFEVQEAVSSLGSPTGRAADDFRQQAELFALIKDDSVVKEGVLLTNTPVLIDAIQPSLVQVEGGYQLRPQSKSFPREDLEDLYFEQSTLTLSSGVQSARNVKGKNVLRGVLSPRAENVFRTFRKMGVLTPTEVAKALSSPEEFFGDDADLTGLSERVIGVGIPVGSAVPVSTEHAPQDWLSWSPKLTLSTILSDGRTTQELDLKDVALCQRLHDAIQKADEDESSFIPGLNGIGLIELSSAFCAAIETSLAWNRLKNERSQKPDVVNDDEVLKVLQNFGETFFKRGVTNAADLQLPDQPPHLTAGFQLHQHQIEGFHWLARLHGKETKVESFRGAILADDMGLGKTIQILAFLSWLIEEHDGGPFLIVCPLGLVENWKKEARRFFPNVFEPIDAPRGDTMPRRIQDFRQKQMATKLTLVSYDTLRRQEKMFAAVRWKVVILDEGQRIKNPDAQISRVVRTLSSRFRLVATGTPVENSLRDLWALTDFVFPCFFGSLRDFKKEYIDEVKRAVTHEQRMNISDRVQEKLDGVFMRRLKTDVLKDLPPINFEEMRIPLSDEQLAAYAAIRQSNVAREDLLETVQALFRVSAHPHALRDGACSPLKDCSFPRGEMLFRQLDAVRIAGEKAIVFCSWRKVQSWLASEIATHFGFVAPVINGCITDSAERTEIIETFSNTPGFRVLILSPRAAGVGLNITAANHVIHYTREWNPAVENQATDRAYRIGQTRPVYVKYFIGTSHDGNTVEVRLAHLLNEKRKLMKDFVISVGGEEFSPEELFDK